MSLGFFLIFIFGDFFFLEVSGEVLLFGFFLNSERQDVQKMGLGFFFFGFSILIT